MRSTKLKLKKHLSNFVAFLVFANTLGTSRVFAAGTRFGYIGAQAAATGKVDGVIYTVAAENSTGIVKSDGTIVNTLADGEVGYNYTIKQNPDQPGSLCADIHVDAQDFDTLHDAMHYVPSSVNSVAGQTSAVSPAAVSLDIPVRFEIRLLENMTVTKELSCPENCNIVASNKTLTRGANFTGPLCAVTSGTTLKLVSGMLVSSSLTLDGVGVQNCAPLLFVSKGGKCAITGTNFTNNNSVFGGAIYNSGTVVISDSKIDNCSAEQGGAILNKGVLNRANNDVTITGCHAAIGGAVANLGEAANFNTNGFKFEASNYATDKGNQVYTSGTMNAITGLILNKSTVDVEHKSDVDIFIENKPIVLSSNVTDTQTDTQFVNTPVVFMTTYDQVGDGPKLWRGAKAPTR